MEKSPLYCEHANENPGRCPCGPDCYCKDNTCKAQNTQVAATNHRTFSKGDVVRLRSGGSSMTVSEIIEPTLYVRSRRIECVWMNAGVVQSHAFDADCLTVLIPANG